MLLSASCGDKKEQVDFGKPTEDVTTETTPDISTEDFQIAQGKTLFTGKGMCASCHLADQKVIGPSIQEIVGIYADKNASIVTFLKGKGEPIVDPSQYEIMKANFSVTKTMTEEELKAIEVYMYSFKK
jgi:cytochrome c